MLPTPPQVKGVKVLSIVSVVLGHGLGQAGLDPFGVTAEGDDPPSDSSSRPAGEGFPSESTPAGRAFTRTPDIANAVGSTSRGPGGQLK